jgi:hypothetical protein
MHDTQGKVSLNTLYFQKGDSDEQGDPGTVRIDARCESGANGKGRRRV